MSIIARTERRSGLTPIPTPHPLITIACLAALAGMLYWGYKTDFQEPGIWLSLAVSVLVISFCEMSRRRRTTRPPVLITRPVLDL